MKVQKNRIKLLPLLAMSMFAFSCGRSQPDPNDFSAAEAHIISILKAKSMKDAYTDTIAPLIRTLRSTVPAPYEPTEFAYVDLNTLKSYVALLEHINASNPEKVSGVRIYFAAHPKSDEKYPGRETVFMVPTVKVAPSEMSIAYNNLENLPFAIKPSGSDKYIGSFEIISQLLNGYDNNAATYISNRSNTSLTSNTSLVLDDLQLTPPPR